MLSFKAICFLVLTGSQNRDCTKFQCKRHLCYFYVQDNFICALNYWDHRRGFRRNRSTADHSAFYICLWKNRNKIGQLVRCTDIKKGYDAARREVLCEVSYNILFEFVILLKLGRFIKTRFNEKYSEFHIGNTLIIYFLSEWPEI